MNTEGFKKKAKNHQLQFFAGDSQSAVKKREGRAQEHWLNEVAAREGKTFYSGYEIFEAVKNHRGTKTDIPEWFYDTLRSQHIPFNFFIPLIHESAYCIRVLNRLFQLNISEITAIEIEYPPNEFNPLKDKTSFDAFISYTTIEKTKGFIGFEIKYTEGGYSPTTKERELADTENSVYYKETAKSGLYIHRNEPLLKENTYRQIWRNHLLASSFAKDQYHQFLSVTIYPKGNSHFTDAIKAFETFLTETGKSTLKGITYETFFQALIDCSETEKQRDWIKYLIERYLVSDREFYLNQLEKVGK
jgi:hypothetical protein